MSNAAPRANYVWVDGEFARVLPPCCINDGVNDTSDTSKRSHPSSLVLNFRVLHTRADAALQCLEWSCPSISSHHAQHSHSQWIGMSALVHLEPTSLSKSFKQENPRLALWYNSTITGRFATANHQINKGECALQATAFAVVVAEKMVRSRCHWCFCILTKKAFQCADCQFARYCSKDCLEADTLLHDMQCLALQKLLEEDAITSNSTTPIDKEMVRLVLVVLSMEKLLQTTQPLNQLVTHNQMNQSTLDAAVKFVVRFSISATNEHHIRDIFRRVQCNAHPLCINGQVTCGIGIFPEAAMTLNHSCSPNVVPSFDPRTRTLRFHAIQTILAGQCIEYSYIDLFQSRARRQQLLRDSFGFDCRCSRCIDEIIDSTIDKQEEENGAQEERVLEQLMQVQLKNNRAASIHQFRQLYNNVSCRSKELAFALRMVEMNDAVQTREWKQVTEHAEALIAMWKSNGLPEIYPTMETLYMQLYLAAKNAGLVEKAAAADRKAEQIRRICGYRTKA